MKLESEKLTSICLPVDFSQSKKNLEIAHKLIRLMHKEKGMGLAANQCGLELRLFVMCVADRYYHCFNPEIIEHGTENIELNEGCLSFPGQVCMISRSKTIKVRYYSHTGKETVEQLDGWAARCFQHELDHLNGLTMFDR